MVTKLNKKMVIIILGIVLILVLAFVSYFIFNQKKYTKPTNVSDTSYEYGCEMIKIADNILDNKSADDTVKSKIIEIRNNSKENIVAENDDEVYKYILLLSHDTYFGNDTASILDNRNKLAKELNLKSR